MTHTQKIMFGLRKTTMEWSIPEREVTSEGFHIFGLDPYKYYSAGYACYLSDIGLQQDSWDIWDNHMTVGPVKDGNIMGYKYFGFGGLDKDTKGIKAFEGTKRETRQHLIYS